MNDVVLAQWPAVFSVGDRPAEAKTAEDLGLDGLVGRIATAAVAWEATKTAEASLPEAKPTKAEPTRNSVWRHPDAHPMVLLLMSLDRYGQDCLEWDPETLRMTLVRDGIPLSQSAWTKLMAVRVVLLAPSPWRHWPVFTAVCRGLAGSPPNFHYLEEPELGHIMVGIDTMNTLDPSRHTTDEIDKYIAAVLRHDSQPWAPPPLSFVQHEVEDASVDCQSCGARHRDNGDTRCVTCGSALLIPAPYVYARLRDAVAKLYTKHIALPGLTAYDGLPEDAAGLCAERLLHHGLYAADARAALSSQLRMLK